MTIQSSSCPNCGQSPTQMQMQQKLPVMMHEGVARQTTTLIECKPPAFIVEVFKRDLTNYPQDLQLMMNTALASNYMTSSKFDENCYMNLKRLIEDYRVVGVVRLAAEWLMYKLISQFPDACIQTERRQQMKRGMALISQSADVKLAADIATLLAFSIIPHVETSWRNDINVLEREVPDAISAFFDIANRRISSEELDRMFWYSLDPWVDSGFKAKFEDARERILKFSNDQKAKFLFDSVKPLTRTPSVTELALAIETPKDIMDFSATAVFRLGI